MKFGIYLLRQMLSIMPGFSAVFIEASNFFAGIFYRTKKHLRFITPNKKLKSIFAAEARKKFALLVLYPRRLKHKNAAKGGRKSQYVKSVG